MKKALFPYILLFVVLSLSACNSKPVQGTSQTALPSTGSTLASISSPTPLPSPTVNKVEQDKLDEKQFKTDTTLIGYKDLARNPDKYKSKRVHLVGKVTQVQEKKSDVMLLIEVTQGEFGLWDDAVWLNYVRRDGEDRILEKDIIQLWGEVKGLRTYTTVRGDQVAVPEIDARYITIGPPNQKSQTDSQVLVSSNGKPAAPKPSIIPAEAGVKADNFLYDELVHNYEKSMIEAINSGDFSQVEFMLLKGSNLYDSQKKLVANLSQKGIKEKLVDYEVKDVRTEKQNETLYLTVREVITVNNKDNEYLWVYTVKRDKSGQYQFSDIQKP